MMALLVSTSTMLRRYSTEARILPLLGRQIFAAARAASAARVSLIFRPTSMASASGPG